MQADLSSMRAGEFRAPNPAGFHTVRYVEHGARDAARTVVCVHGLTRNGRDFDPLAGALAAAGFRVVCPDIVGRGRSDRLADPGDYNYGQYQQDMMALIAHLGVGTVDWVGTSMGGLIGMLLAARPETPIARLVVNDIGPFLPKAALARLAQYVGLDPVFADRKDGEAYLRQVFAPFGRMADADWHSMAEHSLVPGAGGFRLAYDPAIRQGLLAAQDKDVDLWPVWDAIRVPTLLLWGKQSDLLTGDLVEAMLQRGPTPTLVAFHDVGHAPPMRSPAQIVPVVAFLSDRM